MVVVGGRVVEVVARGAMVVGGAEVETVAAVVVLEGGASTGSSRHEDPPRKLRERMRSKTAGLRMIGTIHMDSGKPQAPSWAGISLLDL